MYTIGTSALNYMSTLIQDPTIVAGIKDKLVAFVGSIDERQALTDNALSVNQYTVFFEVPVDANGKIIQPVLAATVYNTIDPGSGWQWNSLGIINSQFLLTQLTAAAGFTNVLYAVQRGTLASMKGGAVRKIDGMLFYARDTNELYVYDKNIGDWVLLADYQTLNSYINSEISRATTAELQLRASLDDEIMRSSTTDGTQAAELIRLGQDINIVDQRLTLVNDQLRTGVVPTGGMVTYGQTFAVPQYWMRCNGSTISRSEFYQLFQVIGTFYGAGDGVTTFNLPNIVNTIIKVW